MRFVCVAGGSQVRFREARVARGVRAAWFASPVRRKATCGGLIRRRS